MEPWERVLAGGFAVFMAGGLVIAYRSGILSHEDGDVNLNEHPLAFSLLVVVNVFCVAVLAWLAAGQELAALWRVVAPIATWRP